MRITITIDTSDIKVDIPPVKPEVPLEVPNDYYTRKYEPLPTDYTPNSNKPFITPVFSEYN
jgi:hypothetical protein